jgi:hypothetical protein
MNNQYSALCAEYQQVRRDNLMIDAVSLHLWIVAVALAADYFGITSVFMYVFMFMLVLVFISGQVKSHL